MVLSDQRHAGQSVRPQQRHVNYVLGCGHLLRQIAHRYVRLRELNRVRHVRRGEDPPAFVKVGAHQELHRLELRIGIRPDPGVNGLADIAPARDIVDHDVFAPHPARFDQLRHQGHDGVRARQTIQRSPRHGRPEHPREPPPRSPHPAPRWRPAARGPPAGMTRHAPLGSPVLVAVDLDRDLLSGTVSGIPQLAGLIEAPEQRVPCLLVVLAARQILDHPGSHAVHHFLVGIRIVPPVPRRAIPTGRLRVAGPTPLCPGGFPSRCPWGCWPHRWA